MKYFRKRKTKDQVTEELYERIKPLIEKDFKKSERQNLLLAVAVELIKSMKWILVVAFPAIIEWIKNHTQGSQ